MITDINVGLTANDGLGDKLRNAFIIVNENFDYINGILTGNDTLTISQIIGLQTALDNITAQLIYIPELQNSVNDINNIIYNINSQITSHNGSISDLYNQITDLQNQINTGGGSQTLQSITDNGSITTNPITANSFIKTGGTASEYLMADGSVSVGGGLQSLQQVTSVGGTTSNAITISNSLTVNSIILSTATSSTIAAFNGGKTLYSLTTDTYPSLTELSYVKGVTGSIQTQINNIQPENIDYILVNSFRTLYNY